MMSLAQTSRHFAKVGAPSLRRACTLARLHMLLIEAVKRIAGRPDYTAHTFNPGCLQHTAPSNVNARLLRSKGLGARERCADLAVTSNATSSRLADQEMNTTCPREGCFVRFPPSPAMKVQNLAVELWGLEAWKVPGLSCLCDAARSAMLRSCAQDHALLSSGASPARNLGSLHQKRDHAKRPLQTSFSSGRLAFVLPKFVLPERSHTHTAANVASARKTYSWWFGPLRHIP